MGRYDNRRIFSNRTDQYSNVASERGTVSIIQYSSPRMRHPTPEEMRNLEFIEHVWKVGDRYWKLAEKHYGDAELWWVIAWFNRSPIEGDLELGTTIQVPLPLDSVLTYMGY